MSMSMSSSFGLRNSFDIRHSRFVIRASSFSLPVNPEHDCRDNDAAEQTNRRHERAPAESVGHDHSEHARDYQANGPREHKITEWGESSGCGRDVRVLVDVGKNGQNARCSKCDPFSIRAS